MWNKDEIKGKGKQIEGAIKVKVGEVTNNPHLEAEGEAHSIETVGKSLRAMMPWLAEKTLVNKQVN